MEGSAGQPRASLQLATMELAFWDSSEQSWIRLCDIGDLRKESVSPTRLARCCKRVDGQQVSGRCEPQLRGEGCWRQGEVPCS